MVGIARGPMPEDEDLRDHDGFSYVRADLSRPDAIEALADTLPHRIDVVVNNVGSAPPRPGGFASIAEADWLSTLWTQSARRSARDTDAAAAHPLRGRHRECRIGELDPRRSPRPGLQRCQGGPAELHEVIVEGTGPRGVRVNSISPGPVATDLSLGAGGVAERVAAATGGSPEQVRAGAESAMPTGRFTRPEEVADLIAILASPRFPNLTGSDFVIDGGMRPTM